jgi:hypothetical protein
MKDRLVELLMTEVECNKDGHGDCSMCPNKYADKECERHIARLTADYLLKNGVIVPPCNVGDTVWIEWKKKIYPVRVYALRFDTKKNSMRMCVTGTFSITAYGGSFTHNYNGTFSWGSVGKTVFLTREEAERVMNKTERMVNEND